MGQKRTNMFMFLSGIQNLMRSADLNITTTMSWIRGGNGPVDGMVGQDTETCDCCATTGNSVLSWWEVYLNGLYPIRTIFIQGGMDGSVFE